jgi:hypothetical protein
VHAVEDAHDTVVKIPGTAVAGSTDHCLPFQRSTSATISLGVNWAPTATHKLGDAHDTAISPYGVCPTAGVDWIDQRRPFQPSANGDPSWLVGSALLSPTAMHAYTDTHETLRSWLSVPTGAGLR